MDRAQCGTLMGPIPPPVPLLHRLLAWCLLSQPRRWPKAREEAAHSQAAADQAKILAELELLQLAHALQCQAKRQGGYAGERFDPMLSIAELFERIHGWDPSHADDWLERMGLWAQEL